MDTETPHRLVCLCGIARATLLLLSSPPFPSLCRRAHLGNRSRQEEQSCVRGRILNTDLSELSKALGRKGVEVLPEASEHRRVGKGSMETIHSHLLVPGILDH